MNTRKLLAASTALSLAALWANNALAQATMEPAKTGAANTDPAVAVADMSDGEVRKIDKDSKKITLKHGDIKNLDMPGMTMVFQVKDAAMLDSVKPGDKVKFKAEKSGSAFMLTALQVIR